MTESGSDGARARGASARVHIGKDLVRRAATFAARIRAAGAREEVGRQRLLTAGGDEFVGHRPYRSGEDLRHLDWTLLARTGQPFVKVHRASRRETWVVALDASASMAVGEPSKLQSAAEVALATVALALRMNATVVLAVPGPDGDLPTRVQVGGDTLTPAVEALEGLETVPWRGGGLEALLAGGGAALVRLAARVRARRIVLLGDFLDVDLRALFALGRGHRHVHLGQVLAPEELDPAAAGGSAVRWFDPERPEAPRGAAGDLRAYHAALDGFCERLERTARQHRMSFAAWSSDDPFENHLPELLR